MRCIFCKKDSSDSRSVEHIIPESLGNTDHVLPRGVVCDSCNGYFARKVEKPVLDSGMFKLLRSEREIPNKKGNVPQLDEKHRANLPEYRLMTRFVGKIGLEGLAAKVLGIDGWNNEMVDNPSLDELRNYVRYDRPSSTWSMTTRTLYPVNAIFKEGKETFEVLHEWDILVTPTSECYIIVAILGVEFSMNLGGCENDGYRLWLEAHNYASPLYTPKVEWGGEA